MSLSDDELERYARQIVLPQVGGVGQRRLGEARVAVVGAGAIGGAVTAALAGAGVGHLTIIDDDRVERSNLHRQLIFRDDQIGRPKAEAAALFARGINPEITIEHRHERVGSGNVKRLLEGHMLVVDGTDNFATRLAVNDACVALRLPLLSAAAAQFQVQLMLMRGWREGEPCYRCFVGDAFDADDCDTCAEVGVLGALTGFAGNFAALLTLGTIVGFAPETAGRLFVFNGLSLNLRTVTIPPDAGCKTCGGKNEAATRY